VKVVFVGLAQEVFCFSTPSSILRLQSVSKARLQANVVGLMVKVMSAGNTVKVWVMEA
jgi:hypothetical protein